MKMFADETKISSTIENSRTQEVYVVSQSGLNFVNKKVHIVTIVGLDTSTKLNII